MRLDKWVSHAAALTRSQARAAIRAGRVQVCGHIINKVDVQVAQGESVTLDGEPLLPGGKRYVMLHKPAGVVTSTRDPRQATALSLLPDTMQDLFPVGRLDLDATGLLLFTDDGQTAHRLISPRWDVEKTYRVCVQGQLTQEDVAAFASGIELKDFTAKPARLTLLNFDEQSLQHTAEVVIAEGKYHQVKRMFGSREKPVLSLTRVQFGPLKLDPSLAPSEHRLLTDNEVEQLLAAVAEKGGSVYATQRGT